jgi:hypothetical protein
MDRSAPGPVVPTPAAQFARLRGRRVVVGVPGLGFRSELRADDPVVHDGRTFVPVLTEQDYYRAEIEEIEAIAPLVPVERVWVEHVPESLPVALPAGALDAPPWSRPTPVASAVAILGRRLVQAVPDGFVRDLRAVSQVYVIGTGHAVVRLCGEPEWYRWAVAGTPPSTMEVAVDLLWTE